LFRIGSTSKLFTATAVMQQVESGALELDRDVNAYLPFRVPQMTLRHLLTHTAGLEENQFGWMMKERAADLVSLEDNVRSHIPARVRRPTADLGCDRGASYSNWGFALLGLVVSRVSGQPFDDYLDRKVFGPLGMRRSTFREPLPAPLAPRLSRGHFRGTAATLDFEYWHSVGPAGSATTTAGDMARFMLAHLGGGACGGGRVLRADTTRLMHGRALRQHPRVNGAALCFYEDHYNGRRMLCHRGKTFCFQSDLTLIPQENAGIFVVLNTAIGSADLRGAVRRIIDHYFPADIPDARGRRRTGTAARHVGTYRGVVRSYRTIEKLSLLTCPERFESRATLVEAGVLAITNLGGVDARWEELEPGIFRRVGGQEQMALVQEVGGVAMLGPFAFGGSRKVGVLESTRFHFAVLAIGGAGLLAAMGWFLAGLVAGFPGYGGGPALGLAALVGALDLTAFWILWRAIRFPPPSPLPFRYPLRVHLALAMILVSVVPAAGVLGFAWMAWAPEGWQSPGRIAYAVIAALEVLFLAELHYWRLVGFRLG
jgi:CubicO group peptidase (beta-lactamase class C family)